MQAQEAVLPTKLTGLGERATLAALISPGMRAFTVAVNEVSGTGGHVMPGDRVDVVLTRDMGAPGGPGGAQHLYVSNLVAQNLRVLGIDQNANPTTSTPVVARAATLEVSLQDAERLAVSAQAGTISLALRKTGSTDVAPVRAVGVADLTAGSSLDLRPAVTNTASPVRRPVAARRALVPADEGGSVIVVSGDAATKVKTPAESGLVAFP
jgi:pilus assembly protein CpaB